MNVPIAPEAKPEDLEVGLGAFLTGLGAVIEGVEETQARMDRVAATRFSVFRYFKKNQNIHENVLSGIFADLLRTDGSHGQGATFLTLFLEQIDLAHDARGDAGCRVAQDYKSSNGSVVETEHVIPDKRRIDIVVRVGERGEQWLAIENKPWAYEQEDQLADYAAYVLDDDRDPDACIVYMSGDGSESETITDEKRAHCLTMPSELRQRSFGGGVDTTMRGALRGGSGSVVSQGYAELHSGSVPGRRGVGR